jgi:hypothetical protein
MTIDLSNPPTIDPKWLGAFTACLALFEPQLTLLQRVDHGMVAWRHTWLLEPDEATTLWVAALRRSDSPQVR